MEDRFYFFGQDRGEVLDWNVSPLETSEIYLESVEPLTVTTRSGPDPTSDE